MGRKTHTPVDIYDNNTTEPDSENGETDNKKIQIKRIIKLIASMMS